jgi:hypothetical protein
VQDKKNEVKKNLNKPFEDTAHCKNTSQNNRSFSNDTLSVSSGSTYGI